MNERRVDFEGCFNFRDIGGWTAGGGATGRWRRAYRADSVHLMTAADAARARQDLGLNLLLDLRGDAEIRANGTGLLAEAGVARMHLPFNDRLRTGPIDAPDAFSNFDRSPDAMVARYLAVIDGSSDLVVDAVRAMAAEDSLPAVFFCSAGKDRTGVLSAVVLGALGVRDEDIVADYVLTADSIERIIGRFAAAGGPASMYARYGAAHFTPYAETMQRVVEHVRGEHGSFAEYLLARGLRPAELDALRAALLV